MARSRKIFFEFHRFHNLGFFLAVVCVSRSMFFSTKLSNTRIDFFTTLRKSQNGDYLFFLYKWRLNFLKPERLELAFKTLSLDQAIEEVKISWAHLAF